MRASADVASSSLARGRVGDVALVTGEGPLTFGELSDRVDARRAELGAERRLVMIEGRNAVDPIVTYLAAIDAGHPVLFTEAGGERGSAHRDALIERFDPDVVARGEGRTWTLEERRDGTRHVLHPDLAMLASTSGSTGSPKLVRLSRDNLLSNALAISEYLDLRPADRAITTLPLHYCYGLSVLNSHLVAGASVRLTERSVIEAGFWDEFAQAQATSFAGVPYTFDLLDRAGFAERDLASLRYVTQAGGRLHPDRVRRLARLGAERGFDLVVMYGQTEATARMAYLPPRAAESAAGSIGIPIPGGRFRIDASGADDGLDSADEVIGELVYTGPNVMMGYAEKPEDFAEGRTVHELRTGDLARRRSDGMYEIVGRMNRFVKIFGLRIDLDRVERLVADDGAEVRAVGCDEQLVLFTTAERLVHRVRESASARLGLPQHAIRVHALAEFPRTSSGKPDTAALVRHAERLASSAPAAATGRATPETIRMLFAETLGRADVAVDDSFAGLGGDSLSYVEVSLRLEHLLGDLPRNWPTLSATDLARTTPRDPRPSSDVVDTASPSVPAPGRQEGPSTRAPVTPASRRRRLPRVETPAVLRAIAIILIVGTHSDLFSVTGGAHLLLIAAGYNLARFQLADIPGRSRVPNLIKGAAHIAVPAALWIGGVAVVTGGYAVPTALLLNNAVGDRHWNPEWQFWFLEAAVWSMVALAGVFAMPRVDRFERRHGFVFALGALALALATRTLLLGGVVAEGTEKFSIGTVAWCLALGWVIARAGSGRQRMLASALVIVGVLGFFGDPAREAVVVAGALVLIWLPRIPVPRILLGIVGTLAAASMFIYLTHWQVYPAWEDDVPVLGTLLSLLVGVAVWRIYTVTATRVTRVLSRRQLERGVAH